MMEAERRSQSQKHRCKHCRKSFPSGRSLGGHMRCHSPAPAPPAPAPPAPAPAAPATTATSPASEPDGDKPQSGAPAYGLRENPKKTWRMSSDDVPAHGGGGDDDKSCRECGKRFASCKSLFGHMRSHSLKQLSTIEQEEEEEEEEEEGGGQQEQTKAEEEEEEEVQEEEASRSRSDTVFGNVHVPRKRRRSRRAIASCSASASEEYYGKEDEEGAITLLMLSRDVRCWSGGGGGGLIRCVQESSDKNSVVVENNKRVDLASVESEETRKAKRARRSQPGDLRNGRRSRGIKKVEESDDASDDNGLIGDHGLEQQFEDSRKDPSSNSASEFGIKMEGSELEASLHGDFDGGRLAAAEKRRSKSRRSFECVDCDKAFHSYQALGGHRASHHKRIDQNADLKAGRGGSGKKAADHECLICGRIFASGQALGGHKKSHLGLIQQQKLPEKPDELLDLNVPASTTEGDCVSTNNGGADSELNSWWIGGTNMQQHEPLLGVISN